MGDIIVVFVIALCLAAVLWYHISRRKKGETGCGCGCSGCSMPSGCGAFGGHNASSCAACGPASDKEKIKK